MTSNYDPRRMATEMMISALTILYHLGDTAAAAHLQHALSILAGEPRAITEADVEAALAAEIV